MLESGVTASLSWEASSSDLRLVADCAYFASRAASYVVSGSGISSWSACLLQQHFTTRPRRNLIIAMNAALKKYNMNLQNVQAAALAHRGYTLPWEDICTVRHVSSSTNAELAC